MNQCMTSRWTPSFLGRALAAFAIVFSGAAMLGAAPQPSVLARSWDLDFRPGELRVITLTGEGGADKHYYYMTFLVTNLTGEERFFAPIFELTTDRGEIMLAGRGVSRQVTQEILERLRNPLLEQQFQLIGPLQEGEEFGREGLLIWPVGRQDINEVSVYAIGLSGESQTIRTRDAETGEIKEIVLRKTMMLRHDLPGELADERASRVAGKTLPRTEQRWILRQQAASLEAAENAATERVDRQEDRNQTRDSGETAR